MAEQAWQAIGAEALTVVADRGYFKSEQILECTKAGITPLVPKPLTSNSRAEGRFDKQDFIYVATDDEYRCPAAERAIRRFTSVENGLTIHKYWSSACPRCPIRALAAFVACTFPSALLLFAFAQFAPSLKGPLGKGGDPRAQAGCPGGGRAGRARDGAPTVSRPALGGHRCARCRGDRGLGQRVGAAHPCCARRARGPRFLPVHSAGSCSRLAGALRRTGWTLLAVFAALLVRLPLIAKTGGKRAAIADAVYRAGALVFGGGHVVLPSSAHGRDSSRCSTCAPGKSPPRATCRAP